MSFSKFTRNLLAVSALSLCASPLLAANCEATVEGKDDMKYNVSEISLSKTCKEFKFTLTNVGKMPKASMGHNLVLAKAADGQAIATDGISAGLANDHIKAGDTRIVAHTKLLGPGESDTITVPASKFNFAEKYDYFCTFPGHYVLMKGSIKWVD